MSKRVQNVLYSSPEVSLGSNGGDTSAVSSGTTGILIDTTRGQREDNEVCTLFILFFYNIFVFVEKAWTTFAKYGVP
jgi:hypothetical protein